ncbi:MAG TPA: HD domain-containing protein [Deferrisomatales bacterium]|nr:HD domain-containing protein [Deferrisomatales bacterium]
MASTDHHRKRRFVKALRDSPADGRRLTDLFLVERKNLATSSRGQPYLRLLLGDRSGAMDAFVWDDAAACARGFREGDLVRVGFLVRSRNDVPQMHVDSVEVLVGEELGEIRWDDFRPGLDAAERDAIWNETRDMLAQVANPSLRGLAMVICDAPGFRTAYLDAAAAKGFHHAYVGGLARHTLAVMRLAGAVAALYPRDVDAEVLLLGAFLHDLGKLEELSPQSGGYTDPGRLLGHILLGARLLRQRAEAVPGFPAELLLHLEHLVLSHHGQKEWGSPVLPQTLEAITLSFLDNLDAKLTGAGEWLGGEEVVTGDWSSFWKGLGTALYRAPGSAARNPSGAAGAEPSLGDIEQALLAREAAGDSDAEPSPEPGGSPSRSQGDFGF